MLYTWQALILWVRLLPLTLMARQTSLALLAVQQMDELRQVAIVDDGCGFNVNQTMQARKGWHDGLWIMHDRIEMVGGKLTIESAIGKGTTVPCRAISTGEP